MTARGDGYRAINEPDMNRRLANVISYGTVDSVDYSDAKKPRVKVKVGRRVTGWIPFGQNRSGENSEWDPLDIGEQVMLAAPSGDLVQAAVITTFPQDSMPAPGKDADVSVRKLKDGSTETRDRKNKTYLFEMPSGGKMTFKVGASVLEMTNEGVTLTTPVFKTDAPESEFTGKVTIRGLLTYLAGLIGRVAGGGSVAKMYGPVDHEGGDFSSNGIVIDRHTHPSTGKPNGNA